MKLPPLVTDANLEIIAEGPVLAVHQSDEILNAMDDIRESIDELKYYRECFLKMKQD